MKVKLFFAWYDIWVGFYWSREDKILYFCPVPMVVISIRFKSKDLGDGPWNLHKTPEEK